MDQEPEKNLFPEALADNDLISEKINGQLIIRKGEKKNTTLQGRIKLATIGLITGVLILIFISRKAGIAAIAAAGALLFTFMNLRERENESAKKSISIDHEKIIIKEGYKSKTIKVEDITEFKTKVQKVENLFVGKITIMVENKWPYDFLEIFGTDEYLVQDDLLIISNHIVDNYLN